MIDVVLDTNVLISALLSPNGTPARILRMIISRQIRICIDSRILLEYENVLLREKFPFEPLDVSLLLKRILQIANVIVPKPIESSLPHEHDKKLYEVAKSTGAYLITGNLKHFPKEPTIVSPADFLGGVTSAFQLFQG
ncbi:MAG: putative toxin-antitoxin system toxin component, PIN family [Holophagales bacterium]|nr:putative toxin-antitoxin system toxin component, PIN family [Holophagales bacterium]